MFAVVLIAALHVPLVLMYHRVDVSSPADPMSQALTVSPEQFDAEMGVLARDGSGVKQDVGEAFRWFTIAAKQGGAQAEAKTQADLEKCRATLAADEQDSELRAAESWLAQHPHADLFVFKDLHSEFPVGEVYAARTNGME